MRRPAFYAIALCLVVYLFTAKGYVEVTDTHYSVETARSLWERGQWDILAAETATLAGPDGRHYSKYGVGLPLYYVPLVGVGGMLAAVAGVPVRTAAEFLISFANLPFAALTLWAFAGLLRHFRFSEGTVGLLVVTLGLGTLTWKYATYDFSEGMQMGLLLAALYGLMTGGRKGLWGSGVALGWLVLVKLVFVVLLGPMIVYLVTRPGGWRERFRRMGWWAWGPAGAGALLGWLNVARFGSVWESGYGREAERFIFSQLPETVPQLLFSWDKGLLVFCPILIVACVGWYRFRRQQPGEAVLLGCLLGMNLVISGAWHSWIGGSSWGPRLLVPLLPLWLLPWAWVVGRWSARRQVWATVWLLVPCMLLQIPGVLVRDQEIHHIRDLMLTREERGTMAPDIASAFILVRHKLFEGEVYAASEFGVASDRPLDLTAYPTFIGLNVWTEHLARQRGWPWVRWLPVLGLVAVAELVRRMGEAMGPGRRVGGSTTEP